MNKFVLIFLHEIIIDDRASHSRATRVAVHYILVLGPLALGIVLFVKNTKYLLHVVDNIIFGMSVLDYPSRTVDNHVLVQF